MGNKILDKDLLYKEYIINNLTSKQIGEKYGYKETQIYAQLAKYGIRKYPKSKNRVFEKYDYLYNNYITLNKEVSQIAEENHVNPGVIDYYLKINCIPRKYTRRKIRTQEQIDEVIDMYVNKNMSTRQIGEHFEVNKGAISQILKENGIHIRSMEESRFNYIPDELNDIDILKQLYIDENKNAAEIARLFEGKVSSKTVREKLKKKNIKLKTLSEAKKGRQSKENHPNWQGGITELDDMLRRFFHTQIAPIAYKRDNNKCQICGNKKRLHAHHIVYFSTIVHEIWNENPDLDITVPEDKYKLFDIIINDDRFLSIDNLITLCKDCHQKIHSNDKNIHNSIGVNMKTILYSTGCPKCSILKKKMDEKNIEYDIVSDVDLMQANGFMNLPMLEVDDNIMDFGAAIKWINGV